MQQSVASIVQGNTEDDDDASNGQRQRICSPRNSGQAVLLFAPRTSLASDRSFKGLVQMSEPWTFALDAEGPQNGDALVKTAKGRLVAVFYSTGDEAKTLARARAFCRVQSPQHCQYCGQATGEGVGSECATCQKWIFDHPSPNVAGEPYWAAVSETIPEAGVRVEVMHRMNRSYDCTGEIDAGGEWHCSNAFILPNMTMVWSPTHWRPIAKIGGGQ